MDGIVLLPGSAEMQQLIGTDPRDREVSDSRPQNFQRLVYGELISQHNRRARKRLVEHNGIRSGCLFGRSNGIAEGTADRTRSVKDVSFTVDGERCQQPTIFESLPAEQSPTLLSPVRTYISFSVAHFTDSVVS